MINFSDKHNCCGCSACSQRCPKHCIKMVEDEEGFLYPKVEEKSCINCGLCEKVCPVLNQANEHNPLECYAAKNMNDTVRANSSSGGIFTALAELIIAKGGIVYGACYNKQWEVIHTAVTTIQGLEAFRGSKYVQSKIGNTYIEIETYLKQGRIILFSGTPCQIAGLNRYLRLDYENLITVEIVCHGTPSPKVWRDYAAQLPLKDVSKISMRDKATGWRGYSFSLYDIDGNTIFSELSSVNKYLMAFSSNLTIRPSCFQCPSKAGKSKSDITLADFWGIEKLYPLFDDDNGVSLVFVNSEKGLYLLKKAELNLFHVCYESVIPFNPCIYRSTIEPKQRASFWLDYKKRGINALHSIEFKNKGIFQRILNRIIKQL